MNPGASVKRQVSSAQEAVWPGRGVFAEGPSVFSDLMDQIWVPLNIAFDNVSMVTYREAKDHVRRGRP